MSTYEIIRSLFDSSQDLDLLWKTIGFTRVETRIGQHFYDAYEPATDAFILFEGEVILLTGENKPSPILRMKAPAILGDISLLTHIPNYDETSVCLEPCRAMILPLNNLNHFHGSIYESWMRDIAIRMQRIIATTVFEKQSLGDRILRWLWDRFASTSFLLPNDEQIARHLCASRDRAQKARRALQQEHLLIKKSEKWEICPPDQELFGGASLIHSIKR